MLNKPLHKKVLIQILKSIYSDSTLGPALGFKGGTAAFMFYNLPRFSVDLNFDLLNGDKEDLILSKMPKILGKFGSVKEAVKKRFTLFFLLNYQKGNRLIKVEISRRPPGSAFEVKHFLGIPMQVIKLPDMVAGKLSALITRLKFAPRDVFDVWFFFKNNLEVNWSAVHKQTKLTKPTALGRSIQIVANIKNNQLLQGLGELVDEKQKDWIKNHLKDEVLFLLKLAQS